MLSQEEYVKKELDRLNLKPSIKEVVLETIDFPMTITQLNELIDKHKKDYTSDEIEISPVYDYNYGEPNIVIKAIVKESEADFNNTLVLELRWIMIEWLRH